MSQGSRDKSKYCRIAKKAQWKVYRVDYITLLPRTILFSAMTFSSKFQQPKSLLRLSISIASSGPILNPQKKVALHSFRDTSADYA